MILKYNMLSMVMLQEEVYEITVAVLLHCVLTFDLYEGIEQLVKLLLVYQKAQKPLNLGFYEAYVNNTTTLPLSEIEYKSSINVASPWLTSSICMASTFDKALVESRELQFVSSPSLSNNQYNCHHACKVIVINKEFGIYPDPYYLDTFSPPVFPIEAIDKVARCYLWLPLAWAGDFHKVQIEYEIAWLDIIAHR